MKFVGIFITFCLLSTITVAQIDDGKKVYAGIAVGGGFDFINIQTNSVQKSKTGGMFTAGMTLNWHFSKNIGFNTGLQFDLESLSYQCKDDPKPDEVLYYDYNDKTIYRDEDKPGASNKNLFILNRRQQKSIYLTIPTMLIFRTNKIGYFRYFGKFGLRNSFLLSQKTHDYGTSIEGVEVNDAAENTKMKTKNSMVFIREQVGIAAGFNWNFSGNTSLCFEVGYYYGFTPLYYKNANRSVYTIDSDGKRNYKSFKMTPSQLIFKAYILF